MRKAAWAGLVLGGMLLLGAAAGGLLNLSADPPRAMPIWPPPQEKYRVAVFGDTQKGLANFSNLLREALNERPAFGLHTGDLVSDNDEGHYRLARLCVARSGFRAPLVVVPGNHDVKRGSDRFRRECGELEQAHVQGRVVFLTVDNASGAPPALDTLDARVAAAAPDQAVVVAMHVPPFDVRGEPLPEYRPFLEWLEKSRVAYLLCGHVHVYLRKTVGKTVVIVNGIGGDYDSWQLDQKACATILDVDGTSITDRKIELAPEHGVWENVEHFAIGHFGEAYRQRPVPSWGATMLLAILTGFSAGVLRRRP